MKEALKPVAPDFGDLSREDLIDLVRLFQKRLDVVTEALRVQVGVYEVQDLFKMGII
jgi:hypothetical protein